jgi:hypothetical protein
MFNIGKLDAFQIQKSSSPIDIGSDEGNADGEANGDDETEGNAPSRKRKRA